MVLYLCFCIHYFNCIECPFSSFPTGKILLISQDPVLRLPPTRSCLKYFLEPFKNVHCILLYYLCEVKFMQLCLILCDPMDYTVHEILQTKMLEWVAFPFCRGSSQPRDRTQVSCIVGRFFTSWATREERILEWIAYPFSRGSFSPRNWTRVFCIAGEARYQGSPLFSLCLAYTVCCSSIYAINILLKHCSRLGRYTRWKIQGKISAFTRQNNQ